MKLLAKQEITSLKGKERKEELDEGLKLARKVDTLRETSAKEEQNLAKFRVKSLDLVKGEIDVLVKEKNALQAETTALEVQRKTLLAPIDLTQEWEKVKNDKTQLSILKDDLLNREMKVIHRESTVEAKTKDFFERDEIIKQKENLVERYQDEARKEYQEAEKVRVSIGELKHNEEKRLEEYSQSLLRKEEDLLVKERDFKIEKEQVIKEKDNIVNEKLHIASQQETLRQTWINIKRLSNK